MTQMLTNWEPNPVEERKVQTNHQLRPDCGGISLCTLLAAIRVTDNYREPDRALLD